MANATEPLVIESTAGEVAAEVLEIASVGFHRAGGAVLAQQVRNEIGNERIVRKIVLVARGWPAGSAHITILHYFMLL